MARPRLPAPISLRQSLLFMDEDGAASADDGGSSPVDAAAFDAWLLADPSHVDQVSPNRRASSCSGRAALGTPRPRSPDATELAEANRRIDWLARNGARVYRTLTQLEIRTDWCCRSATSSSGSSHAPAAAAREYPCDPAPMSGARASAGRGSRAHTFLRVGLILERLLHRSPSFHPLPDAGVSFLSPLDVREGRVRYINDAEGLGMGEESFEAWRDRLMGNCASGCACCSGPGGAPPTSRGCAGTRGCLFADPTTCTLPAAPRRSPALRRDVPRHQSRNRCNRREPGGRCSSRRIPTASIHMVGSTSRTSRFARATCRDSAPSARLSAEPGRHAARPGGHECSPLDPDSALPRQTPRGRDGWMHEVLTLGLVARTRALGLRGGEPQHLAPIPHQALERAAVCSFDPSCSEHDPRTGSSVHLAACHACQFASETSCERGDRSATARRCVHACALRCRVLPGAVTIEDAVRHVLARRSDGQVQGLAAECAGARPLSGLAAAAVGARPALATPSPSSRRGKPCRRRQVMGWPSRCA